EITGDVNISRAVHGNAFAAVFIPAAEVGRESERRINGEGLAMVIPSKLKSDVAAVQHKPAGDLALLARRALVDMRAAPAQLPSPRLHQHVAVRLQNRRGRRGFRSCVKSAQGNSARISLRAKNKIAFELCAAAVEDQIHAGIDPLVAYSCELWYAGDPVRRIA